MCVNFHTQFIRSVSFNQLFNGIANLLRGRFTHIDAVKNIDTTIECVIVNNYKGRVTCHSRVKANDGITTHLGRMSWLIWVKWSALTHSIYTTLYQRSSKNRIFCYIFLLVDQRPGRGGNFTASFVKGWPVPLRI